MEKYTFKGCDIEIQNNSKIVSTAQCVKFLLNYTSHILASEILPYNGFVYDQPEVEAKTKICFLVEDSEGKINVLLNNSLELEIIANFFHATQLCSEQRSFVHGSFFHRLHRINCKGKDIMSY